MFLVYDTETTGLPRRDDAPLTDFDNWPRVVQIAWQLHDAQGVLLEAQNYVIQPEGFDIPFNAAQIHGITTAVAQHYGKPLREALKAFRQALDQAQFLVGHNLAFDNKVLGCEFLRQGEDNPLPAFPVLDTGEDTREYCQLPGGKGGGFKMPRLEELHEKLFGERFAEAHNAAADVEATARCFLEAVRRGIFPNARLQWTPQDREAFLEVNQQELAPVGLKVESFKELARQLEEPSRESGPGKEDRRQELEDLRFTHLHVHSQYSILQATCDLPGLIAKAREFGIEALALTDHANLYGAFSFVESVRAAGLKPIVGCEFYLCRDHRDRTVKDNGYQIVCLAKNKRGYHHLAKLSSLAFTEGFYYVPRIDKALLLQYKEDLMVTTGNLYGEIPRLILNVGEKQAEEAFQWYHQHFGEDFYVELNRHGLEEEKVVNETLLRFARKYGVRFFASNDVYYLEEENAHAHDILLCVKENEYQSTPIGRGRGYRYGFPNNEYYFKSPQQMQELFRDLPEALETTQEIADKVESYPLAREVLLPKFDIPAEFIDPRDVEDGGKRGENAYLRHLTYQGAKERYGEIDEALRERLDFELETIANTGYPGYFLIVQDFTSQARKMGVSVGPGRGSAAGSAVAYCIGITNVDPIKYNLLFERFLNPDRVSLPDIDIDFDDEGRGKIIDWVVNKYGQNQVAQIITYGTMAGKSAIRDAARVMQLPLSDADRVAKLVPDTKLGKLLAWSEKEMAEKLRGDAYQLGKQLRDLAESKAPEGEVVRQARVLEGSVRNTGIHACGVIITPDDITKFVPVATAKEADLLVTQFDNSVVEAAGMLKMDFLGLRNLSIIKDAIELIEERQGIRINPDEIPLDDEKTLALFARGETLATFQFESAGMQKHLRALKPDKFADLIAMNALYRPGPMEYIPNFIARKHGQEEITFDLPEMEEYLAETYGITVYQEQVMLLSQKLAGFTKGEADVLRKAMGKKKEDVLAKMRPKFMEQGVQRGHPEDKLEKIWEDWKAFARYAFNKSHSTCYSVVAFHTGYLKAHYPQEYMASMLTHKMSDITELTKYMEECRRMGIPVLGPDVNESEGKFTVNEKGEIRFGMSGMKGVGSQAVEAIVAERRANGPFHSIFDLLTRVDLRSVNRKTLENLALGGAFDGFPNEHRALYFYQNGDDRSFLEKALRYAQNVKAQKESAQASLFGDGQDAALPEPALPVVDPWPRMLLLNKEKEVNGMYISSHPLDDFSYEMKYLCSHPLKALKQPEKLKEFTVGGIIVEARHLVSRNGKPFGIFSLEDYTDKYEFRLFGEEYLQFKPLLEANMMVFIKGYMNRYRPRWQEEGPMREEVKIRKLSLLQDVLEQMTNQLQLKLSLADLNDENIERLNALIEEHPGDKQLEVRIFDPSNPRIGVQLLRRKGKGLAVTKESLDALARLDFARFRLQSLN